MTTINLSSKLSKQRKFRSEDINPKGDEMTKMLLEKYKPKGHFDTATTIDRKDQERVA